MKKVSENLRDISVVINIILWLGVIAEFILGAFCYEDVDEFSGIILWVVAFATIIPILLIKSILNWMADIYDMIYDIRNSVSGVGSKSGAGSKPTGLSYSSQASAPKPVGNFSGSWICDCGTRNTEANKFCKGCGERRHK